MAKLNLQTLPELAPQQGPNPQLRVDSRGGFGEAVGQGLEQLGVQGAGAAIEQKRSADLAAVEDKEAQFQAFANGKLKAQDGSGILQAQGEDAIARSTPTLEQITKQQGELAKQLASEDQRQAFVRRTNPHLNQVRLQVEGHVGDQVKVVEGQKYEAKKAAVLDTIANSYDQPQVVSQERQRQEPLVMLEAKRRGYTGWQQYPPDPQSPAGMFLQAWRADVAKTILNRLIADKDALRAKAFLSQPVGAAGSPALPPVPEGGTPHDLTKPILKNADGSWSTELTTSITTDDAVLVVPTIVDGKPIGQKEAARRAAAGELAPVGTFPIAKFGGDVAAAEKAAETYAVQRHVEEEQLRGSEAKGPRTNLELLGTEAPKYLEQIRHASEQVEAYDLATKAIEKARDPKTGRVDPLAARAAVASAPPMLRREVHLNLESQINAEDESWKRQVGDRWNTAKTAYEGGADGKGRKGLGAIDGVTASWLRANAPDAWRHLQDWAHADLEHEKGAPPTPAQELAFTTLAVRMSDHPEEFVGVDGPAFEQTYLSQLAKSDRRALLGHFLQTKAQAHKPDETLPKNVVQEILSRGRPGGGGASLFPAKGDDPGQWPPEKAQLFTAIYRDLLQLQAAEKLRTGKPPDPKVLSERIDYWMRKGTVVGSGLIFDDTSIPRVKAQLLPDYQGKEFSEDIPDSFAKEARVEFQRDPKASFPATPENVRYLWEKKRWIEGGRVGLAPARPESFQPYDRTVPFNNGGLNLTRP